MTITAFTYITDNQFCGWSGTLSVTWKPPSHILKQDSTTLPICTLPMMKLISSSFRFSVVNS
ncbi:hypothetical protein EWB00_000382 [Schistosoma japonicum]|uniref:Uncharacterized protein n=1 Tax=Schistosoma japonicum TaxID=6182 RepID=A0A4Z2DJ40_SCHJA|nr:hypothetical protein EWB00_000382 [Schistosoma japonicum]